MGSRAMIYKIKEVLIRKIMLMDVGYITVTQVIGQGVLAGFCLTGKASGGCQDIISLSTYA